jgi:hypothetical protein
VLSGGGVVWIGVTAAVAIASALADTGAPVWMPVSRLSTRSLAARLAGGCGAPRDGALIVGAVGLVGVPTVAPATGVESGWATTRSVYPPRGVGAMGFGEGLAVAMSVTAAVVLGGGVVGAMLGVDAVPSVAMSAALALELGSEEEACVLKGGNAVAVPTSVTSELLIGRPAPVEVLRSLTLMITWSFKSWDAVGAAVGGASPRSAAKVCGELSIPWAVRTS